MSNARASTDEETAPLLDAERARSHDSFFSALTHPARKLTNLEKLLTSLAVILLVLASIFIGLFAGAETALKKSRDHGATITVTATATATHTGHSGSHTRPSAPGPTGKPADVCTSPECVLLSAEILQSMNMSADPCNDFYEFANGGWLSSHSIPADRGAFGSFNAVADNNKVKYMSAPADEQKIILKILQSIPEELSGPGVEAANLHKVKAFHQSCEDIDRLNEIGLKPLVPLVDTLFDLFGRFDLVPAPESDTVEWLGAYTDDYVVPADLTAAAATANLKKRTAAPPNRPSPPLDAEISGKDDPRKEKLTKTLAWLHSRGVDALLSFNIEGDAGGDDPQIQSLWLYQTSGGLPSKEYYEEKPILDLYTSVVKGVLLDIAKHTGDKHKRDLVGNVVEAAAGWPWPWPGDGEDKPKAPTPPPKDEPIEDRLDRLAVKVVEFERKLIMAGADPEYIFNPHFAYNPYATTEVDKQLPFLDLPTYLSAFAIRAFPENITVTHPPYLKSASKIIESTPDHVLSAYFVTRLAMTYSTALGPATGVRSETRRLQEVLSGLKKGTEENREDVCLNWVDNVVGYIVGREFVREAFSKEAKEDGETIINNIVDAFFNKLPHISWMDETSAKAAQAKAKAIIPKVGYPLTPDTTDPESLARWYARVEIDSDDFFGNILRSNVAEEGRTWASLGRQRDRKSWLMYPQTVNAYYSPPDGEIVFPAGILQPPFFSHSWPSHLKYGAFGAVAAHELTHAFDNTGSQYDERGRLREWWTNTTVKAFEERAQCVAKQYSKYYVLDAKGNKVHVNGNLTNGEDIADSGLAQAHLAWKNSLKSDSTSVRLPGLDFTDDQLFFLSYARVWASLSRPAAAVSRVRTDPHSPNFWRATGTLRNLDAFHKAFNCKAGSKMNPPKAEQCELW